uniref:Putative photosystem I PsaA/PsaB n=1 Tax=Helianthus annuus TaxID=4232 RepID=A0A251VES0_HELAN
MVHNYHCSHINVDWWILIVGAAAHAAIFMVRDYDPTTRYNDLLDRVLRHRDAIISHLNWACIPGNSVLWFFIIRIWPFFPRCSFVWAFSLMFLFSGRGYWQELIESIVWAHKN